MPEAPCRDRPKAPLVQHSTNATATRDLGKNSKSQLGTVKTLAQHEGAAVKSRGEDPQRMFQDAAALFHVKDL